MQPEIDFSGRVALVTGASKGIGQSTAVALASCGADVAINYLRNADGAEATRREVEALGRRALVVQADVTDEAAVEAMAGRVAEALGPADVLVNNAGWARQQPFDEITPADFDGVLAANLRSAFLCTRAVLPGMRQRGWGRIVNVSSGAAHAGGVVGVHYNAAKAGMEGLTRGYASKLVREGITVNVVAPALIDTGPGRDHEARRKIVPLGREGTPEEVAQAIVMAAANAYMTGQVVVLNGGLYYR